MSVPYMWIDRPDQYASAAYHEWEDEEREEYRAAWARYIKEEG